MIREEGVDEILLLYLLPEMYVFESVPFFWLLIDRLFWTVQGYIIEYFQKRPTPLARSGLKALSNTLAGIYFIPFKTGASLEFSFMGQSVPNREQVRETSEKKRKYYFPSHVDHCHRCDLRS